MDTREKILDAAQGLIQRRSFHGFSFQDVADGVGVRKASLYHYFDSKDAMAVAVLDRAADWIRSQFDRTRDLAPADRLEAYFDMFRGIHGKAERMCPGGSFGAVFDAVSSPVQAAVHRFATRHIDELEDIVREGVKRGQFAIGDQRPRDVAMQILAGVQGALLSGRVTSDPHFIDAVAAQFRTCLSPGRTASRPDAG
ncbi:MAG: TetR/AcrR family transcriptional regulator [Methyloceanibacter sp.]|nr:TetR/AcrR family transcriptional regulator [Methyloceanibacter sp.]